LHDRCKEAEAASDRITTRYNHLLFVHAAKCQPPAVTSSINVTDLKAELEAWIAAGVAAVAPGHAGNAVVLERPKQPQHGDYASNAALQLAKAQKRNPRELAQMVVAALKASPWVEKTEIAGAGFINVFPIARRATVGGHAHRRGAR
jgi:hypothetical protein